MPTPFTAFKLWFVMFVCHVLTPACAFQSVKCMFNCFFIAFIFPLIYLSFMYHLCSGALLEKAECLLFLEKFVESMEITKVS